MSWRSLKRALGRWVPSSGTFRRWTYDELPGGEFSDLELRAMQQQASRCCPQGHRLEEHDVLYAELCVICGARQAEGAKVYTCPKVDCGDLICVLERSCHYKVCKQCYLLPPDVFAKRVSSEHRCDRGHLLATNPECGLGACSLCERGSDDYLCPMGCHFDLCIPCHRLLPEEAFEQRRRETLPIEYRAEEELSEEERRAAQAAKLSVQAGAESLFAGVLWEMDLVFLFSIVSLAAAWATSYLGHCAVSFAVPVLQVAVAAVWQVWAVSRFRTKAEQFEEFTLQVPSLDVWHRRTAPRLRCLMQDKRCFVNRFVPAVPYWFFFLLMPKNFMAFEWVDSLLDGSVAGLAFLMQSPTRKDGFADDWYSVPVVGGPIALLGLPGMLTQTIGMVTLLQVVRYASWRLWATTEDRCPPRIADISLLAELSGFLLLQRAAASMTAERDESRLERLFLKSALKLGVQCLPTSWLLVSLTVWSLEEGWGSLAATLLSLATTTLALFTATQDAGSTLGQLLSGARPGRHGGVASHAGRLMVWIPASIAVLANALRLVGIFACPSRAWSLLALGCT